MEQQHQTQRKWVFDLNESNSQTVEPPHGYFAGSDRLAEQLISNSSAATTSSSSSSSANTNTSELKLKVSATVVWPQFVHKQRVCVGVGSVRAVDECVCMDLYVCSNGVRL